MQPPFDMKMKRIIILVSLSILLAACRALTPAPAQTVTIAPTDTPIPSRPSPVATTIPTSTSTPIPPTATSAFTKTATSQRIAAKVLRVIDGDTIQVSLDGKTYTVRYIGIDTPETVAPGSPVQWMGPEATAANKTLVENKTVYLEKDVSETDKYGRLLRYVYVGDIFVNAELVRQGYAQVSTYPPDVKYQSLFLQMQQEARNAGRGLWGAQPVTTVPTKPPTPVVTVPTPTRSTSAQELVSLTSPVAKGAQASITVRTSPGSNCSITVYYKSGASQAAELGPKTAGSDGLCSWTWKVGTNTTPGTWRIVVTTGTTTREYPFVVQ